MMRSTDSPALAANGRGHGTWHAPDGDEYHIQAIGLDADGHVVGYVQTDADAVPDKRPMIGGTLVFDDQADADAVARAQLRYATDNGPMAELAAMVATATGDVDAAAEYSATSDRLAAMAADAVRQLAPAYTGDVPPECQDCPMAAVCPAAHGDQSIDVEQLIDLLIAGVDWSDVPAA